MTNKFGTARPYAAAYVIMRKENKIAMVLRGELPFMPHFYGLPAGKAEIAEPFTQAAIREAKEEVGVDIDPNDVHHALTMHRYSHQDDGNILECVDMYFEVAIWRGEPHNAEPHMHDEFIWIDIKNLPENTIPYVKQAIEDIKSGKTYSEYGWEDR